MNQLVRTSATKVREMMIAFDQSTPEQPTWPDADTFRLRIRLMIEEHLETLNAAMDGDVVEFLDGILDCDVVNAGSAIAFGLPYDKAFDNVHRSNMSKLTNGVAVKDAGGKVIKPPTYTPADLRQFCLKRNGMLPKPDYDPAPIVIEEIAKALMGSKNIGLLVMLLAKIGGAGFST